MRNGLILVGIAFAVAFAIVVGNRLSDEAMAVVVGAICGISASIPVSIGFVIAANRNWGQDSHRGDLTSRPYQQAPQPPVVVIAPPQPPQSAYPFNQGQYYFPPSAPPPGAPRDFKIIGDE